MKRAIRATLLTVSALMCLSAAFSQEYTLKLNVKEGDVFKYKMTMDIDFGGQGITVTMPLTNKVLKVEENGNIVVESAPGAMVIKFNDQEIPQSAPPASTITYKPNGAVEKVETAQGALPTSSLSTPFPDKPVKVGDKWSHTVKGQNGLPDTVVSMELVGVEKVGEIEAVKIKVSVRPVDAKEGEGFSADGHTWFDPKTGMLVKSEMRLKGMPFEGAPMPLDGVMKMELVK